jgi:hypothetical protein
MRSVGRPSPALIFWTFAAPGTLVLSGALVLWSWHVLPALAGPQGLTKPTLHNNARKQTNKDNKGPGLYDSVLLPALTWTFLQAHVTDTRHSAT